MAAAQRQSPLRRSSTVSYWLPSTRVPVTLASRPHSAPAGTTNEKIWSRASDASLHDGATRLTASVVEPVTRNSYGLLALSSAGVNVGAQQRNRRRARAAATDHRRARAVGARLVGAALAALAVAAVGAARLAGAVGRALCTGARRALGAAGSVERPEALARRLLAEVGGAGVAVVVAGGARRGTTGAVDKVLLAVAEEAVGAGDVEEEDVGVHGVRWPSCSGETQTASSASAPGRTGSAPS